MENIEYQYNTDWQLTRVIQDREGEIASTSLTWENGNAVSTKTYESNYHYKSTATYGTDKVTMSLDFVMGVGTMYVPGAYEELLPIYGKMSEYLPVEIRSYSWPKSETEPSEPNEVTTYQYNIVDGYLMQAVVTTTFPGSHVVTDTYVFEYE